MKLGNEVLEIHDDVVLSFVNDTLLEFYEYDSDISVPAYEKVFKAGSEIEGSIIDINEEVGVISLQVFDGSVTFIHSNQVNLSMLI